MDKNDIAWGDYDGQCIACDLWGRVDAMLLCRKCSDKLERDLIRDRDWERSAAAWALDEAQREALYRQIIKQYGREHELIEPLKPKKRQRKGQLQPSTSAPRPKLVAPAEPLATYTEEDVLAAIETAVRATTKSYGWQHLGVIGQYLRQSFVDFSPARFGHKKLLDLIAAHPEQFKIKWSAPAKKGASHVWVRLAAEPKRKEGYADRPS